jgi:hypothetical protein
VCSIPKARLKVDDGHSRVVLRTEELAEVERNGFDRRHHLERPVLIPGIP